MAARLSIFAGTGALVPHALGAAIAAGFKVQVLALTPRPDLGGVKVIATDIANPLAIIWSLKAFRTTHILLAGGIHLPDKAREGLIRFANGGQTAKPSTGSVGDATLAALGTVLKKMTGADLVGVHEIAPDLLAGEGHIAGPAVDADNMGSVRFALDTARSIGRLDIGQAVVVCGRRVIAVEDIGGTDALIDRVGHLVRQGLTGDGACPLVLAKAAKPQQPLFVDLPAIGPDTISKCAANGIAVVAVEAGRSLVIGRPELTRNAEQHKISVCGVGFSDG